MFFFFWYVVQTDEAARNNGKQAYYGGSTKESAGADGMGPDLDQFVNEFYNLNVNGAHGFAVPEHPGCVRLQTGVQCACSLGIWFVCIRFL